MIFIPKSENFKSVFGAMSEITIYSASCMSQCTGCVCSCRCSCSSPNTSMSW